MARVNGKSRSMAATMNMDTPDYRWLRLATWLLPLAVMGVLLGGNLLDYFSARSLVNKLEKNEIRNRTTHLAAHLETELESLDNSIARIALRPQTANRFDTFFRRRAAWLADYQPACVAVMHLDELGEPVRMATETSDTTHACEAAGLIGPLLAHDLLRGPEVLCAALGNRRHLFLIHPRVRTDDGAIVGIYDADTLLAQVTEDEAGIDGQSLQLTVAMNDGTMLRYEPNSGRFMPAPSYAMRHATTVDVGDHRWMISVSPVNTATYARMRGESVARLIVNLTTSSMAAVLLYIFLRTILLQRRERARLKNAEERLRLAITGAEAGVWDWWPETGHVDFSDAWAFFDTQTTPDGPSGFELWKNNLHPDDRAPVLAQLELHVQDKLPFFRSEYRYRAANGAYRWALSIGRIIARSDSGKPQRMTGIFLDVTERRLAEEARERLAAIVKGSGDAIISLDGDARVTTWNESAERIFGVRRLEALGKHLWRCCGEAGAKELALVMWRVRMGETVRDHEMLLPGADGETRFVSLTFSPIRGVLGRFEAVSVVARDVTAWRRAERALLESREDLAKAQAVARLGSWRVDLPTQRVTWSRQLFDLLDIDPETFDGDHVKGLFSRIHPDDLDRIIALARTVLAERKVVTDTFRILLPNGQVRHISGETEALRNEEGEVVAMFGTLQDISNRKEVEDALRESQQRYALAVRAGKTGIWDFDLVTGRFNPDETFRELYDFPADQEGSYDMQVWLERIPEPDRVHCVAQAVTHIEEQTTSFDFEHRLLRPDGTVRWVYALGQVIRNGAGRPMRLLGTLTDITERKHALLELRESEERLEFAMRGADLGMWEWTPTDDAVKYDRSWIGLLGYTEEEARTDVDFFRHLIHPADLPRVLEMMQAHLEGRLPHYEAEFRIRARDGRWKWFSNRGRVVARDNEGNPLRISGVIRDITEQKSAEAALRRETMRAQHYLDIAGVMMLALDHDGCVSMINRKGCQILGYEERELIGKPWFEACLPENIRDRMRVLFRSIMDGATTDIATYTNPVITRSGEERIITWFNTLLYNEAGHVEGVLSSGEDITERLRAEQEAKVREQQLIQADKMASLGVLVSGVAHEINNPNAFIVSNASTFAAVWQDVVPVLDTYYEENGDFLIGGIQYSRMRERAPRLIQGMLDGAERIRVTVQELRRFAQQEPDGLIEPVSLNEVLESAITLLQNMINKSTRRFTFTPCHSLPAIQGSFRRLEQVAINLIQNACQALPNPECAIRVHTELDRARGVALLFVEDEGAGIPPEDLPRITDPFFTTKRAEDGTGLGLSICATIISEHRGQLTFTSRPGRGTVATVALPTGAALAEHGAKDHGYSFKKHPSSTG